MKELKLRGYVTPADCGGDLQKAIDTAKELGINKAVVDKDIRAGTIFIPSGMYLVLKNTTINASFVIDGGENWSFSKKWINIEGENATIKGNITVFNAVNVTVTDLTIEGHVSMEYANWARIVHVKDGKITVGRGCNNVIVQKLQQTDLGICGDHTCGRIVPGSKPDVTNVVVQDCTCNAELSAAEDCGLLNVQLQNLNGKVTVGDAQKQLPPEQFMNLTFINIRDGITEHNPTKHTYIK